MDLPENVGGRDRLARAALAVVLTIAAIRSLRNGKRLRGLLAGIGALVFGFNATTKYCALNDELHVDTTGDEVTIDFESATEETASETDGAAVDDEDAAAVDDTDSVADEQSDDARTVTCAECGEPIVPGQGRGPNENDEIVHEDCP